MIEITDLKKEYTLNDRKKYALDGISVKIPEGCFVSVIGPSGAGKSTLLRSINGMISVDGGKVEINGKNISSLKGKEKREVQKNICMIFQDFCLVKSSTVIKNVLNACLADMNLFSAVFGIFGTERKAKAAEILERVGMAEKINQPADSLSGGEQQRTAIARAIMQEDVLELMKSLQKEKNITVIMNSHNLEQAVKYSDWIIGLNSGRIIYEGKPENLTAEIKEDIYRRDNSNG